MIYEKITEQEFKQLIKSMSLPNGTTPRYEYESYDAETGMYTNFVITKTAQEVNDEWLINRDKPIEQPTDKMEVLTNKISILENEVATLKNRLVEFETI